MMILELFYDVRVMIKWNGSKLFKGVAQVGTGDAASMN